MTSQSITIRVANTRGSAPRDAGTWMRVSATDQTGTIGGGRLEWEATSIARDILNGELRPHARTFPLGPDLGQCCGGSVRLEFTRDLPPKQQNPKAVWIWGAGHVGRAIAAALAPMPAFDVVLVDTSQERFPDPMHEHVTPFVAAELTRAVSHAPDQAEHVILTYSHDLDLELCNALLRRPTNWIGLIGSQTKWARFQTKLSKLGHSSDSISAIQCPIGDPRLGKHPQEIAIGVAAAMIARATRPSKDASK